VQEVEVGTAEHLALQHFDLVVVALDGARAAAQAQAGDDGVEVLTQADREGVQGRDRVGQHVCDPSERPGVLGGAVQGGAARQGLLEPFGPVLVEAVGVARHPAGHVPGRGLPAAVFVCVRGTRHHKITTNRTSQGERQGPALVHRRLGRTQYPYDVRDGVPVRPQ
jgi:hypothetical protein